jgi:predicted ArsR family transcriptional regulator
MSRQGNAYKERGASIVFLLTQKPRSLQELQELTGCTEETVHGWLMALQAEGLLERHRAQTPKKGAGFFIYEWQHPTTNHTDEG